MMRRARVPEDQEAAEARVEEARSRLEEQGRIGPNENDVPHEGLSVGVDYIELGQVINDGHVNVDEPSDRVHGLDEEAEEAPVKPKAATQSTTQTTQPTQSTTSAQS
jgi:hypothetical protein